MQRQHFGRNQDSAQHTLKECPAWASEQNTLVARIERLLCLPGIVSTMLVDQESNEAFFCEAVMLEKQFIARVRERADFAPLRCFFTAAG